jgi:hypothetical protein
VNNPPPVPLTIALIKGTERFVFRYAPGDEAALLTHLVEMANDPESGFDWFDAGCVSHIVGQRMSMGMKKAALGIV